MGVALRCRTSVRHLMFRADERPAWDVSCPTPVSDFSPTPDVRRRRDVRCPTLVSDFGPTPDVPPGNVRHETSGVRLKSDTGPVPT